MNIPIFFQCNCRLALFLLLSYYLYGRITGCLEKRRELQQEAVTP